LSKAVAPRAVAPRRHARSEIHPALLALLVTGAPAARAVAGNPAGIAGFDGDGRLGNARILSTIIVM